MNETGETETKFVGTEIAIIGLAGHYPKSKNVRSFWRQIREGRELIRFLDEDELRGLDPARVRDARYVRAASVLDADAMGRFDARFFGISPKEAALLDPQHRHFLECAWEALEDAGYDPGGCPGRVGVYAGAAMNGYLLFHLLRSEVALGSDILQIQIANDKDYLPTRVSYKLGLRGPSHLVQSACSSSLVAIHAACQSLLNEECDVALVGGSAVHVHTGQGYLHQPGGVASVDGHCRSFDADASGTIFGSGVGCVVLKPLEAAMADGDSIYAVILGTAVNNDGNVKAGYTALSVEGIHEVIAEALANAGVHPETVGYVEGHGMATPLGDAIEVEGMTRAYRAHTRANQYCALGSVKSNVGHLDAASGVTGLIKTAFALHERVLPPTLHFRRGNPAIRFESTPFYVNDRKKPWTSQGAPRRAGVTSVGIGGTNAHVVLEEAPPRPPSTPAEPFQVLVLSARTEAALERATDDLADALTDGGDESSASEPGSSESSALNLADAAFTLQCGRARFEHRRAVVARDRADALDALDAERWITGRSEGRAPRVAFLLSGQGAQYAGMAAGIHRRERVFREAFDACAKRTQELTGIDLGDAVLRRSDAEADEALRHTAWAQPALFAVEYALARLLMHWGLAPQVMIGHSLGELVAATLAGVFTLDDAIALVCARARQMASMPEGAMLSVPLSEADVAPYLAGGRLSVAAINAPASTVVSGPTGDILDLARKLEGVGIRARRLRTSHAFHSAMMDPAAEAFAAEIAKIGRAAPRIPFVSNVTGELITDLEAVDPAYWARHLRSPVRFAEGIASLMNDPSTLLIEVGPGSTLVGFALRQGERTAPGIVATATLPPANQRGDDVPTLLGAAARAWVLGVDIDWKRLHERGRRRRISLPTYPFEREHFWIVPDAAHVAASKAAVRTFGPRPELASPFEAPRDAVEEAIAEAWRELLGIAPIGVHDPFLELGGASLLAVQLLARLRARFEVELSVRDLWGYPTVAQLAEQVRLLQKASRALSPPLVEAAREARTPLSFAQQGLWFLQQLDPSSSVHNMPVAVRLTGALDVSALDKSLQELVRRHAILRTRFVSDGEQPRQDIAASSGIALVQRALDGLSVEEREAEVQRCAREESQRPFVLAEAPLVRATLLRTAAEEHVLLLTMHHIVSDAWSMGVIVAELGALYPAFAEGRPSPLEELPIQYADYAVWQRQWLSGGAMDEQLAYWDEQLEGTASSLSLPYDRPPPRARSFRGAVVPVAMAAETSTALMAIGRHENATPFMTLLAAFCVLLHRYTGEEDILVGTPVSNRRRPELETLVGYFINTLVLRADVSGEPTFHELVRRMREVALGAFAHPDVPFEKLVEKMAPGRDPSRSPLQVTFVLQDTPMPALAAASLTLAPVPIEVTTAEFDLTLSLAQTSEGLRGTLAYRSDVFDPETAERMARHYETLLESIAAAPSSRVTELAMLTEHERTRLLAPPAVRADGADRGLLHERFALQAARTPDAVAVVCAGEVLTYRELDRRSNQVAHHVRSALGFGAQAQALGSVGIVASRSPRTVAGMLGIVKAGAAYVRIDPSLPAAERDRSMRDAKVSLVLEDAEPTWGAVAQAPEHAPGAPARRDGSACILDGSMTHAQMGALVAALGEAYALGADDVWALVHSPASDPSVAAIWSTLLHGGRLEMGPANLSPAGLDAWLGERRATIVHLAPRELRRLLRAAAGEKVSAPRALRCVFLGGEALDRASLRRWWERHGDETPRLVHVYGVAQAGAHIAHRVLSRRDLESPRLDVIGPPLPGMCLRVLDEGMRVMPFGAAGALYVGAAHLSSGLHRTGDKGRVLPNGDIELLGRRDIGAIEGALCEHPAVHEAVVAVREDDRGEERLVAYLVFDEGAQDPRCAKDPQALRRHLQAHAPESPTPAAFVWLDRLPERLDGTVDRAALPDPDWDFEDSPRTGTEPRTEAEQVLARIWAELLQLDSVRTSDNFFSLGGDSILAIRVVSKAREAGLTLTLQQLIQHQTIAALATLATLSKDDSEGEGSAAASEAARDQGPAVGSVVPTPIQRWFFEQDRVDPHHFNQAVLLQVAERLDRSALARAARAVVEHHDALRLRFVHEGETVRQEHAADAIVVEDAHVTEDASAALVDLSWMPPAGQSRTLELMVAEAQGSLALETGPVFRILGFDLGEGRPSRLAWIAHHLVVDGVSWRILLEDLETAYGQARRGEPIRLPRKTTSFQRWAERLSAHARTQAVEGELPYWRSLPPGPVLPLDFGDGDGDVRQANTVGSAKTIEIVLDPAETRALVHEASGAYRTRIDDALLTALGRTLARFCGAPRVRIELEGHGRREMAADIDLSRTVGWFTTSYPVVLELPEAPIGEALKSVKEQLRAIPNQGIGYGLLRYLRPDATELARQPAPEVSFNDLGPIDEGSPLFGWAPESIGPLHSPRGVRAHVLDVLASVRGGRLHVGWTYSENLHRRTTIERLVDDFTTELRAIAAHCRAPEAGGRTPSDFTLATLTQASVDRIVGTGAAARTVEDLYPLSPMQHGMLYHALHHTEAYVQQLTFRASHGFDPATFEAAFHRVLERHPIFRTAFVWDGLNEPLQRVHAHVALPWAQEDWRALPATEHEARLASFLHADRARGVALDAAPSMRVTVLQLGEHAWQVVWTFHHVSMDGWSLPIVVRELFAFYEAARQNTTAALPPPRPYRDYVAWLARQDRSADEAFWRAALGDFDAPTSLRIARRTSAHEPNAAPASHGEVRRTLSADMTDALERFARAHGLTLATVLEGAWGALLCRYSGEDDVVFGVTVSGRSNGLAGIESMVGLFINTLPVRVRVDGEARVARWLNDLQARQAEQLPHAHTPLVDVQGWSGVARGQALFESLLIVENYPIDRALQQGKTPFAIAQIRAVERTNYPITVVVRPGAEMAVDIAYDAAIFDGASIERMGEHFEILLRAMIAEPAGRIAELPLMGAEERHRVLVTWNATAIADAQRDRCIHEHFEAFAAEMPEAPAIVYGDASLPYGAANRRANRLAHHLRARGIGPEDIAGVCLPRGIDAIVSLFGIWKAGGAYVPLDPELPPHRIALLLEDTGAKAVVTTRALRARLSDFGGPIVCIDDDDALAGEAEDNPVRTAARSNLAYVLYTSGSSGRPKGVMVQHGSLANLRLALARAIYRDRGPRLAVGLNAPLAFDASVKQIIQLAQGCTLHVLPDEVRLDARALAAYVERLDVLDLTPTQLKLLLADGALRAESLPTLLLGGEAIDAPLWKTSSALPRRAFNVYGPTECTVDATVAAISSDAPPNMGKPLANVRVYVLDRRLEPSPIGVPGELYIAGGGVARGYLGQPELTAERFLRDPFDGDADARMYRTGDLVRWNARGELEFLGRVDRQIKVHGHRIELEEIESALREHPGVRDAVAVLREDAPGDARVVAYLVAHEPEEQLRAHLRARLPAYMVPSAFVTIDALPLTANGKIDRRALPRPDAPGARSFVAPRNDTEARLAGIFAELVAAPRVGVDDDFFALGGHSLLATRLMARIHLDFHVRLPMQLLFESPTVAALAKAVEMALDLANPTNPADRNPGPASARHVELEEGEL